MIAQKIQDALNAQIQAELYSSNLYLSMAAFCDSLQFKGFAHWMQVQSAEERGHALKLFEYLTQRGGRPVIREVQAPPQEFKSPRDVFEQALAHEQHVTGLINNLYALVLGEKDYASQNLLQWFVSEQVEEEANAMEIVNKLKMIGESSNALFFLDKELGQRGAE